MSRRIEITVPSEWAQPVREVLEDHFSKFDAEVILDLMFRKTRLRDPKCKYHKMTRETIWHDCLEHRFTAEDGKDILDAVFDRYNKNRENPEFKYYNQLRAAPEEVAAVRKQIKKDWDYMRVSGASNESSRKFFDEQAAEKPNMVVEMTGVGKTLFVVTVPGAAVSATLERLRKNGIGSTVGRIILTTVEYVKPGLDEPLVKALDENGKIVKKGGVKKALVGFQHFQRARQTTEEIYNGISNGAAMNINTWMNLTGACILAGSGLATNVTVFIVGSMLISPIMGPILGMTMGYRVMDWPLFKTGFINEVKMALTSYFIGCIFGFLLGDVGNTYKWPNSAMMPEGQAFNLIISIIVSAAAGMVLGVSMTTPGGNSLVGTAISAGLLPPLVNSGMLMAYSTAYENRLGGKTAYDYYEMGVYSILFYITHVVTIIIVANLVFWLKDIDPRFKGDGDFNFDEIPSLARQKHLLTNKKDGLNMNAEAARANFFVENIKDDLKNLALDTKDRITGVGSVFLGLGKSVATGVVSGVQSAGQGIVDVVSGSEAGATRRRRSSLGGSHSEHDSPHAQRNPMHSGSSRIPEGDEEEGGDEQEEDEDSDEEEGGRKRSPSSSKAQYNVDVGDFLKGGFKAAMDPFKKAASDLKKAVELDESKRRWRETTEGVNYEDEDDEEAVSLLRRGTHQRRETRADSSATTASAPSAPSMASPPSPSASPSATSPSSPSSALDDPFKEL